MAAGVHESRNSRHKKGNLGTAKKVNSSLVGYMENNHIHPCRLTTITSKNYNHFQTKSILLFKKISKLYKIHAPGYYNNQHQFIKTCNPLLIIPATVFSTATINVDFCTRTHVDSGDYDKGLGNISVFNVNNDKTWSGCEFMIPDYKIAFELSEGDVLLTDVHNTHCNNVLVGKGRLSLVLYVRKHLNRKCLYSTSEDLIKQPTS